MRAKGNATMHYIDHHPAVQEFNCPLLDSRHFTCRATQRPTSPDPRRQRVFCLNDNHDNCPFYLCFLLKRSRPKSRHSRQDEYAQK